jgi:hypothetical protein
MIGLGPPESIVIKQPTAPTTGATVTLFDSAVMFWPHCLRHMKATMLEVTFEVLSQDVTLSAKTSTDGGTTYTANLLRDDNGTATMPLTVASSDAPRTYRFILTPYDDFQLNCAAGVTPPASTWRVGIVLHCGNPAVAR